MDNLSTLDILAFTSNGEGKDIRATVRLDSNIHFNVISTAQAHAACLPWSISEKPKTAIDSNGNCYESSKYLSLRWCEANKTKTWDAVFYIVNDCPHDIILDEASLPRRRADSGCYPVASAPITEAEKRLQEQRQREVEDRKAKEREQAEKDREERERRRGKNSNGTGSGTMA